MNLSPITSRRSPRAAWRQWVVPLLLWAGMWGGIGAPSADLFHLGTGGWIGLLGFIRAASPLVAFYLAAMIVLANPRRHFKTLTWPEGLLWVYGTAMLVASAQDSPWFSYGYWGIEFIACLVVLRIFLARSSAMESMAVASWVGWSMTIALLALMAVIARGELFAGTGATLSGYGVVNRVGDVAGTLISRSSGIARLAAAVAIPAFVGLWATRAQSAIRWFAALALFAAAAALVWLMQSRGSLFSLAFALAFVLLFFGRRTRIAAIVILVFLFLGALGLAPQSVKDYVTNHATRGQGLTGLESGSGRTVIWRDAWHAIQERPLLGYGPQGDRQALDGMNAQNGPLYAWLSGGIVGFVAYVGAMLATWVLFFQALRRDHAGRERFMLIACGGILAFFTARNIPENTAAQYSFDLLLQLPAMVYIAVAARRAPQESDAPVAEAAARAASAASRWRGSVVRG